MAYSNERTATLPDNRQMCVHNVHDDQVNLVTSVLEHMLEQHMNRLNLNEMTATAKTHFWIKFVYTFWNMSFNVCLSCM